MNDQTLQHQLAADLDGAFPGLVAWTQDELYSGLRGLCRNDADAADAAQETLLRAFRALSSYEATRIRQLELRGWMWTIALNVVRNTARTRSRRPREVALVAAIREPMHQSAEAEANLDGNAWPARLAQLSAAQRTAVVLRHVVDMTYREIATVMDRPAGTVKADVHRGLAALRTIIEREDTQ